MEQEGTLNKCYLGYDAWLTCSSHAFSTETQEVMGLLLGRWAEGGDICLYFSIDEKLRLQIIL